MVTEKNFGRDVGVHFKLQMNKTSLPLSSEEKKNIKLFLIIMKIFF